MTSAGRPDAPVLLVTKLHPPSVPAQTIARERLFERLRDGRGLQAHPRRVPGRLRQVDAARRVARGRAARAARRVGDARRGRQRRGRAVVARDRGARPRVPGARGGAAGRAGPRRAAARGRAAAARERARRAGRGRARPRRLPPALERRRARDARVVRRPPAGDASSSCSRPAPTRRSRSARCGPAASCSSCARTTCASRRAEARRVPQRPPRARPRRRRRRPARRAHRGLAGRHLPRGAVAGGQAGQARARAALRRHQRARRRLPRQRGARRLRRRSCSAFMLRTSVLERLCAPLCDAVLDGSGSARRARVARALEPLPAAARRPAPVVPLPPPVRPAPARRAGAARARRSSPALHRRAFEWHAELGHDRRGDPPRRRGARVRRGRRADRRDAGSTTPTPAAPRPSSTGCCASPRRSSTATQRLLLVRAWISALRGREADMRAALARLARSASSRTARCPTASPRSSPASCVLSAAFALGRRGGDPRGTARGRPSSRGRTRRGGRWSRGRSAGAHYCNGDLDQAERWLTRDGRARARGRPVDRRHRRDRRPLADRRPARAAAPSSCGSRRRPSSQAREHGLLEARRGRRGAHRPRRRARRARPPRGGAALARAGRLPAPAVGRSRSTSPTG